MTAISSSASSRLFSVRWRVALYNAMLLRDAAGPAGTGRSARKRARDHRAACVHVPQLLTAMVPMLLDDIGDEAPTIQFLLLAPIPPPWVSITDSHPSNFDVLHAVPSLQSLEVFSLMLDERANKALVSLLMSSVPRLTNIILSPVSGFDMTSLCRAISNLKHLCRIHVHKCDLRQVTARSSALSCNLRHLNLPLETDQGSSSNADCTAATSGLCAVVGVAPLRELGLRNWALGDANVVTVCDALAKRTELRTLSISGELRCARWCRRAASGVAAAH